MVVIAEKLINTSELIFKCKSFLNCAYFGNSVYVLISWQYVFPIDMNVNYFRTNFTAGKPKTKNYKDIKVQCFVHLSMKYLLCHLFLFMFFRENPFVSPFYDSLQQQSRRIKTHFPFLLCKFFEGYLRPFDNILLSRPKRFT